MIEGKDIPLLVIGAGSIGERHIATLQKLGYQNVTVFRQRNLPMRNIQARSVKIVTNWNEIKKLHTVAAFICTPTNQHIQQAIDCAELGIHILVEKPLALDLRLIEILKNSVLANNVYLQVAYMLRYHPLFLQLKEFIENEEFGKLLNFQTYWGEYLPDWHPWEDYRDSYAARKELGGGAALTLSHDIDIVIWLVDNKLSRYYTIKNHRSSLQVNVESAADINFEFENGITGHSHLNFFEKSRNRNYRFVFENASVEIDYFENKMNILKNGENKIIQLENFERNKMFEEQSMNFMKKIRNFKSEDSAKQIMESEEIIKICGQT